jgi:hypothetical protein
MEIKELSLELYLEFTMRWAHIGPEGWCKEKELPPGLYYARAWGEFIGINRGDGQTVTKAFDTLYDCKRWLCGGEREAPREAYVCPGCHNDEHVAEAKFCAVCGLGIPLKKLIVDSGQLTVGDEEQDEETNWCSSEREMAKQMERNRLRFERKMQDDE